MRHIAMLVQCAAILCLLSGAAHADPPRSPSITCHGGGLTAVPRFGTVPPGVAEYSFSGVCTTRTGQDLGYQATAKWTPSESNPANANASEIYRISTLSGPSRSDTAIIGARCDSDPWLNPQASCTRLGDNVPDELRIVWPELASGLFPHSRRAIPYGEQDALRKQYNSINRVADAGAGDRAYADVTVAARAAPPAMDRTSDLVAQIQPSNTVRVQIRYPLNYGYRDAAGLFDASPNSCSAFRIEAIPAAYKPGALIGIATEPHMRTSNDNYVCEYLVSDLPVGEPISLRVSMSDQGAAAAQPWTGGREQPSAGQRRTILNGSRQVILPPERPRALEVFDMVYSGGVDLPETVRLAGRVKLPGGASTGSTLSICESARLARARNSPAAPGLEGQCRAHQLQALQTLPDFDALAAKGPAITAIDPLATELRNQQPDDAARRGFDIGMAAAEGQTGPGPGKQRIHDALPAAQQGGYAIAVAFSLERNRYAERAAKGAAITLADPTLAAAREAEADVFYRLGFDIATAIFGDPALGAHGNTATGPGSLGIRDSLSEAGQRGFNVALALHLSRSYVH